MDINMDEAQRFLSIIDPMARPQDWNYRAFLPVAKDGDTGRKPNSLQALQALNIMGYGAYVVVNGGGHSDADIKRIRALFVDFDQVDDHLDRLELFPFEPSIIVESSPGKHHAYWCVEGMPVDEFTRAQKKLIALLDSDPSISNPSRVMRLPGYIHNKAEPYLTNIYHEGQPSYSWAELKAELDKLPEPTKEKAKQTFDDCSFENKEGGRNTSTFKELCAKRAKGWDYSEIWSYAKGYNEEYNKPPLELAELRTITNNAAAYEVESGPKPDLDTLEKSFFGKFSEIPDVPVPKTLCGDWLRESSFNIFHSRAGKGKSALLTEMVYAMKTGGEWLGQKTSDPGATLWVNGDMDMWRMKERMSHLGTMADLWHICFFDMMSIKEQLVQICARYKFVIFDNRACLFGMKDVNSPESWEEIIELLRRIAHNGTTIILVTHSGKGEGNSSSFGSSAQEWLVDTVAAIVSKKVDNIEYRHVELQKERGEPMGEIPFFLVHNGQRLVPMVEKDKPTDKPAFDKDAWRANVEGQILAQVLKHVSKGEPLTKQSIRTLFQVKVGPINVGDKAGRALLEQMLDKDQLILRGDALYVWG